MDFKFHSDYQPAGDQPQAIKELVEGFKAGNQFETLLKLKDFLLLRSLEQK